MFFAVTKFPELRVLAVFDQMANLELLEAMLLDFACDFEIVDNNADALDLHATHPFDIILLDVLVPDIDGPEAIHRIRTMPPPASNTHIVILTTDILPNKRAKCAQAGISAELKKPLKIRDLEQVFLRLWPKKAVKFP